jgi:hypothetical protein
LPSWDRPQGGVSPRAPPTRKPSAPLGIFHGYPADLIAEWCGVSLNTAQAYKAGRRKPSRSVMRLFTLHRDQRVLGPKWKGWVLTADSIVDPDGNETNIALLHNYFFMMQYARQLAEERGEEALAEFYKRLSA